MRHQRYQQDVVECHTWYIKIHTPSWSENGPEIRLDCGVIAPKVANLFFCFFFWCLSKCRYELCNFLKCFLRVWLRLRFSWVKFHWTWRSFRWSSPWTPLFLCLLTRPSSHDLTIHYSLFTYLPCVWLRYFEKTWNRL